MNPTSVSAELTRGRELLHRLFETATARLRRHGISLRYDPAVIDWLVARSDWHSSLNPLRTLDGEWHRIVAKRIEDLMLRGEIASAKTVTVRAPGEEGHQLVIECSAPAGE